tara:strand:+ start:413 stop:637 length:225 start_codon:yes stop_codon:yes gene_type:complete
MSLDELNELLPTMDASDPDSVLLLTHTRLNYHTSIQGHKLIDRISAQALASASLSHSPDHRAKQAQHGYELLQG